MKKSANDKKSIGFGFIQNGKYPDFIKTHGFFRQLETGSPDDKIFPYIGLPNSIEDCVYVNTDLGNAARSALCEVAYNIHYDNYLSVPALQHKISAFYKLITFPNYDSSIVKAPDGRVELRIHSDMVVDGALLYKKGKGIFKIYNALCEEIRKSRQINALDTIEAVKHFNTHNVPGKGMRIAFSSSGEKGFWDIATISMRGIASCQAWDKPQARALISALSSRFCGVIFITTTEPFNEYGSRMLRRCMVRYCIHKTTKKPAILMDNIYPSWDAAAATLFKEYITKRTGFPVLTTGFFEDQMERQNYVIPMERTWDKYPLSHGEEFYMDSSIAYKKDIKKPFANIDNILAIDRRLNFAIRNFVSNYDPKWQSSGRKALEQMLYNYELNFLGRSLDLPRTGTQEEWDRSAIRSALIGFDNSFSSRIRSFSGSKMDNSSFECQINDDLKKFVKQEIYKEYKKLL